MTKKDYVKLANALSTAWAVADGTAERTGVTRAVIEIRDVLAADSPSFNKDRFINAVFTRWPSVSRRPSILSGILSPTQESPT
jgi:hypothetical protein